MSEQSIQFTKDSANNVYGYGDTEDQQNLALKNILDGGHTQISLEEAAMLAQAGVPALTHEEKVVQARRQRDALLQACDWTQVVDVQMVMPLDEALVWKEYRQQLRGITAQPAFPDNISWPNAPK